MDYTVFDARRAGFRDAVFVVRPELESQFHETIGRRLAGKLPVRFVHQRLDSVPDGFAVPADRVKPWGTGHAVLALATEVQQPFAVVNADDFYGQEAFAALIRFFAWQESFPAFIPSFAMIGYRLGDTLSPAGTVSRGVCRANTDGWLEGIVEILALAQRGDDGWYRDESGREHIVAGATLVSRNCWGFTPEIFSLLESGFQKFLADPELAVDAEFLLPTILSALIQQGQARVKVLPGGRLTFGMTYQQDAEEVQRRIAELIEGGVYPEELWA